MTATSTARSSLSGPAIRSFGWRVLLILAATAAIVLEAPAWARAPLAILALLATLQFCLRRFGRRSPVDRVLVSVGAVVVGLGLLGLALNLLPWGLSPLGWGVTVAIAELAALSAASFIPPGIEPRPFRMPRIRPAGVIWGVLIAAVLAGALGWAVGSFNDTHSSPLALSGVPSGSSLKVTISSAQSGGTYDLIRSTGTGSTVIASDLKVAPDAPATVTVRMHAGVRETIELVKTGETKPLRELILDNRASVTGAGE
jgi:hypothetical protein